VKDWLRFSGGKKKKKNFIPGEDGNDLLSRMRHEIERVVTRKSVLFIYNIYKGVVWIKWLYKWLWYAWTRAKRGTSVWLLLFSSPCSQPATSAMVQGPPIPCWTMVDDPEVRRCSRRLDLFVHPSRLSSAHFSNVPTGVWPLNAALLNAPADRLRVRPLETVECLNRPRRKYSEESERVNDFEGGTWLT